MQIATKNFACAKNESKTSLQEKIFRDPKTENPHLFIRQFMADFEDQGHCC